RRGLNGRSSTACALSRLAGVVSDSCCLLSRVDEIADTGTFVAKLAFKISSVTRSFMILRAMRTRMVGPPGVISVQNRKAVTAFSPELPLRLPWVGNGLGPPTATRLHRISLDGEMTQPPCRWIIIFIQDPRVAEATTLGWRTLPRCG